MAGSIKLSPKHGLNSTMLKCFWCGEDVGIALCGRLKKDAAAPPFVIDGYNPCNKCIEHFKQGILTVGVQDKPLAEGFEPICKDEDGNSLYPDGSHIVLTPQGVARILDDQAEIDRVIECKAMFLPSEIVHQIVEDANKLIEEEKANENNAGGTSADS